MMNASLRALCLVLLLAGFASEAEAQALDPRFGIGLNGMLSTEDGFGLGLQGRASAPINADVSAAVDLGITGFILGGTEDATYVFTPQVSAIIILPSPSPTRLPYLMAGVGGYLPVAGPDNSISGPTVHAGIGWVQALTESSLFYEINPALVIGENSIDFVIPFRIGLIFR